MRVLRLLVVLPVIGVSLAAGPAVAADDDSTGLNGLLGQILRNVTAKAPTTSDASAANGGGADAGKKSTTKPADTEESEGDVTASLQQGQLEAVDDSYTVMQNSGQNTLNPDVMDNDKSPSTAVYVNSVSEPPHGSVNGEATVYTPDTDFVGTDTFTYTLHEPQTGTSNQATVTITVTPTPTQDLTPVAADDAFTVAQDSGQTKLNVFANDTNTAAGALDAPSKPAHGTVSIQGGDHPGYLYTPDPGFHGTDTFTYSFTSYAYQEYPEQSNTATVTIQVTPGHKAVSGDDDLLSVGARCSGDVTFTNISDLGLEGTYGDLPSEVDGDFVLAPGDSETITTGRDELEYRADGPGDQSQQGLIEIPSCSHDDDDDGDDDDDESDEDDDGDGDDDGGGLPDTGADVSRLSLAAAIILVAVGASMLNVTRFRRSRMGADSRIA